MFQNAIQFNKDISGWDVSSVTNMVGMFEGVTLSIQNYNSLLIEWSKLNLKRNVTFDAGSSKYRAVAVNSKNNIINTYTWTINDGGLEPEPPEQKSNVQNTFKILLKIIALLIMLNFIKENFKGLTFEELTRYYPEFKRKDFNKISQNNKIITLADAKYWMKKHPNQ